MRASFVRFAVAMTAAVSILALGSPARGHDTWVQAGAPLVRVGDLVHVDLLLGNHGNEHRDFKIAGKVAIEPCTFEIVAPGGESYDLKPDAADLGYAPKEGYWTARFTPGEEGVHAVVHSLESIHGTTRGFKSAKTYFHAANSLDKPALGGDEAFSKPVGHPLELVLLSHAGTMGPGNEFLVQLLFEGQPLANETVSFIPRGHVLAEGFDAEYERKTDANGKARFTPKEGNFYLVVAHRAEPGRKGDGYDATKFSATLVLNVPQICPCCE